MISLHYFMPSLSLYLLYYPEGILYKIPKNKIQKSKIPNRTKSRMDKIPNWRKSRTKKNPEWKKIPNWTKPEWKKSRIGQIPELNKLQKQTKLRLIVYLLTRGGVLEGVLGLEDTL